LFIKIVCAWCGKVIGAKEVNYAPLPVSHSICCECRRKLEEETESYFESAQIKETERR